MNLMLADAAQVHMGKLFVIGGSTTMRVATPGSNALMAIAGTISVPWDQANQRHILTATLQQNDHPYLVPTPIGDQAWRFEAQFEAGRPPGLPRGCILVLPFAAQFAIPNLLEGSYEFRFSMNGELDIAATIPMIVIQAQPTLP